jgi:hypothetical protein
MRLTVLFNELSGTTRGSKFLEQVNSCISIERGFGIIKSVS